MSTYETEDGYIYKEAARQEYAGNNCVFSAGWVTNPQPEADVLYFCLEKDGVEPTRIMLTPDEMQALVWVMSGAVWSYLYSERKESI